MRDERQELLQDLKAANRDLFERLWAPGGPIAQALGNESQIADTYRWLLDPTIKKSEQLQVLSERTRREIKVHDDAAKQREEKIIDPKNYGNAEELEQDKVLAKGMSRTKAFRDELLDPNSAPTDFKLLNHAYGLALLREKESQERAGQPFNSRIIPYYMYNQVFFAYQEIIDIAGKPSPHSRVINEIYTLNSQLTAFGQEMDQRFSPDRLAIMAGISPDAFGRYDQVKLTEQFHRELLERVNRLQSLFKPQPAEELKNTLLDTIIAAIRKEAAQEIEIIKRYANSTNATGIFALRAHFNASYFNPTQVQRLKEITSGTSTNFPLREHLIYVIKEKKRAAGFAQLILDFMDGKITDQAFSKEAVTYFGTFKNLDEQRSEITKFFSDTKKVERRAQSFQDFLNDFIKQMGTTEAAPSPGPKP